jgi:hypothetical protein
LVEKLLWNEIEISNFSRGLEPLNTVRTPGVRSQRVGFQNFGTSGNIELLFVEIAIRDFPTGLKGIVEDRCLRVNPGGELTPGGIEDRGSEIPGA